MREILFRGKRRDNGKWWYGSYLFLHTKPMDWTGMRVGKAEDVHYIIDETDLNYAVDPETIGQYTGLTDKNGKKIFEGDIIRHHNDCPDSEIKEIGIVFWDEEYCGWRRTSNGKFHHGVIDTYRLSLNCVYEKIGNIHDNPELMKGDNDAEIH